MRAFSFSGIVFGLALCCFASPAAGEGRLIEQRIEGTQRLCIYQDPLVAGDEPRGIGRALGERCPEIEPRVHSASLVASPMALLVLSRNDSTGRLCTYEYMGRRYLARIARAETCPLTPHFSRAPEWLAVRR